MMQQTETQPIRTPDEAFALLRAAKLLTLTSSGTGVPSLVEAVVGGPIKGSWWAHRDGKTIYALATALDASPDVLTSTIVAGRVTFVHRGLWAPLYRTVTDGEWRSWARAILPMSAIDLLDTIERERTLRLQSPTVQAKKDRDALKRAGLVLADQEHTESGRHESVLRSWRTWEPPPIVQAEARRMSSDEAQRRLMAAGATIFGSRLPKKKG